MPLFSDFSLKDSLQKGIAAAGFTTPSPIQKKAIPVILAGNDIIGQAHTGTGKTAAFGIPAIEKVSHSGNIEVLIIAPTRELAIQVGEELRRLGTFEKIRTLTVFGGQSYRLQTESIRQNPEILVATPGRLLDLMKKGYLKKLTPKMVILDEADEMLDMGFLDDIQKIFSHLPENRQTLFFSATMPSPIQKLAKKILKNPQIIKTESDSAKKTNENISEKFCVIRESERDDAILRLIDALEPEKCILFTRTKREADRLAGALVGLGYPAGALHGDMEQNQRRANTENFRAGKTKILVATDVAARGLDIENVSHVFNFHIPFEAENYVHRIGRTGRAGQKGVAITLVTPAEFQKLKKFKAAIGGALEHFEIPTRQKMKIAGTEKIIDRLAKTEISKSADEMVAKLLKKMPPERVAAALATEILKTENISGPEKIGFFADEFLEISRKNPAKNFGKNRGNFRRKKRK